MRQAWYGPLVQLGDISAHVGCHVQLVVFILQCQPPERVRTLKGSEVMRSILYVGDSSCSHIKVSLWNNAACCHDISAGDIIFLQNMKIVEFRGEVELASAQFSEVTSLLKRQDFLPSQGVENAVDSCQHGPLVKEKFKSVTSWAHQTQWNLISLLNRVSSVIFLKERVKRINGLPCKNVDMRGQREWTTASEEQVRKCSSIVEATSIQEHCVVEFSAAIGEMFLPCMTNSMYLSLNHDGCLLFSKHLHGKAARGLLRELLCIGCETCGRALEKDSNGVYAGCRCGLISPFGASDVQRAKQKQAGRIFRPFYLHVGDQSGQMTLLVTHAAAVHMFASISADNVFRSLQGDSTMDFSHQTKQDVHSRANDVNKLVMNRIDHGLVLILLIRCLLSSKNSPFRFRAICHPYMRGSLEHLNLLSVGLPMIN